MGARFDTVCKGCEAQCIGCSVDGKEPVCLEEMKRSTSAGKNTTLESLLIEHGYWRATNRSRVILACYNSKACLGGVTGEKGFCVEGYEGPCEYDETSLACDCTIRPLYRSRIADIRNGYRKSEYFSHDTGIASNQALPKG